MRWFILCCLLFLAISFPSTVRADCESAMSSADKATERAWKSFREDDWKSAHRYMKQATQKYTTARHSCDGEQKKEAIKKAASIKELGAALNDLKILMDYQKAVTTFKKYHSQGSQIVQQKKWKEAIKKYEKAASTIKRYTNSKNKDVRADAQATYDATLANVEKIQTIMN